jgi:hypothetical protein
MLDYLYRGLFGGDADKLQTHLKVLNGTERFASALTLEYLRIGTRLQQFLSRTNLDGCGFIFGSTALGKAGRKQRSRRLGCFIKSRFAGCLFLADRKQPSDLDIMILTKQSAKAVEMAEEFLAQEEYSLPVTVRITPHENFDADVKDTARPILYRRVLCLTDQVVLWGAEQLGEYVDQSSRYLSALDWKYEVERGIWNGISRHSRPIFAGVNYLRRAVPLVMGEIIPGGVYYESPGSTKLSSLPGGDEPPMQFGDEVELRLYLESIGAKPLG